MAARGTAAVEWVECSKCGKWRKLPGAPWPRAEELPDVWTCEMARWNPARATCAAGEEPDDGMLPLVTVAFAAGGGDEEDGATVVAPLVLRRQPSPAAPTNTASSTSGSSGTVVVLPRPQPSATTTTATTTTATMGAASSLSIPKPGAPVRALLESLATSLHRTNVVLKRHRDDPGKGNDALFESINTVITTMRRVDEAAREKTKEPQEGGGADAKADEPEADPDAALRVPVPRGLLHRLDRPDGENDPTFFTADVVRFAMDEHDRLERARKTLRESSGALHESR